jgi:hypothetical protein
MESDKNPSDKKNVWQQMEVEDQSKKQFFTSHYQVYKILKCIFLQ